jgi:radical SAM superfamily enzyme YgiQ (UPF0313 family)
MRGCPNKCRFCQARSQYFPLRERKVNNILNLALEIYNRTGYEEISLGGLSVSDYPHLETLLKKLVDLFKAKAVGVCLPSLKPKAMIGSASSLIAGIKKTGLTFAPEAGTERLRRILDKDFDEHVFFRAIEEAYASGYQHVKLYFMIGLPTERKEDLDGILDFSTRVSEARRKTNKAPAQVNISINTLIPKPHTPLQWLKMEDMESIKYKQDYLRKSNRNKRLELNFHNRQMSFLEAVLSRGDRRLSKVIYSAFKKGVKFDAWGNRLLFDRWMDAFKECDIDPNFYLQDRTKDEILPWDFIDTGIRKDALSDEFNKLIAI